LVRREKQAVKTFTEALQHVRFRAITVSKSKRKKSLFVAAVTNLRTGFFQYIANVHTTPRHFVDLFPRL
jgi:hypothetical protein